MTPVSNTVKIEGCSCQGKIIQQQKLVHTYHREIWFI